MEKHGFSKDSAVIVGDRHEDAEAAKANGMRCIGVTYGYDTVVSLEKAGCWKLAETFGKVCVCGRRWLE